MRTPSEEHDVPYPCVSMGYQDDPPVNGSSAGPTETRTALRDRITGMSGTGAKAAEALTNAIGALYDEAIDKVLARPYRITSAAEARALLAADEDMAGMADKVQRVAVIAVPALRWLSRGARMSRVPWALVASSTASIGLAVHTGVREVQALGSLIAHEIEEATGRPADPDLVKKLTVELYLAPKKTPKIADRKLRPGSLARRWVFRGAFGRETEKDAMRALDAAERLDVPTLVDRWQALPPRRGAVANR